MGTFSLDVGGDGMTSDDRDQRVAIVLDSGTTQDAVGQQPASTATIGTYFANVMDRSGITFSRGQQMQATSTHLVRVRADSLTRTIKPYTHYFTWRSRRLNPVAGVQPTYRDLEIEFECEEQVSGV